MPNWSNVIFTDESQFDLQTNDKFVRVWKEESTGNWPQSVTEHHLFLEEKIMMFAGVLLGYLTDLHTFRWSSRMTLGYRDEVLDIYAGVRRLKFHPEHFLDIRLHTAAVCPAFVLMDVNVRLHRT